MSYVTGSWKHGRPGFEHDTERRAEAIQLIAEGWTQQDLARRYRCTARTILRWMQRDPAARAAFDAAHALRNPGPTHGRIGTYTSYGCRCDECREVNRIWQARRNRERRRIGPGPEQAHGTASTYKNWGCRCEPCTKAHSRACLEYRQRVRAS